MGEFEFFKLQASGNDFILINALIKPQRQTTEFYKRFAKRYCSRRFSIGADGVIVIEESLSADFRMRIFNPDGSEAEMCGNGARAAALWASQTICAKTAKKGVRFETQAGLMQAKIASFKSKGVVSSCVYAGGTLVKLKMSDPGAMRMALPLKVNNRVIKVNSLNTGVPHAVVFVQGLDGMDVQRLGKAIRLHKEFHPQGTNVDFVEVCKENMIQVRTYERGVEAETFACGTGVVASAVISWFMMHGQWRPGRKRVRVKVKSGHILTVGFLLEKEQVRDVWLEGKAEIVYKGIL